MCSMNPVFSIHIRTYTHTHTHTHTRARIHTHVHTLCTFCSWWPFSKTVLTVSFPALFVYKGIGSILTS